MTEDFDPGSSRHLSPITELTTPGSFRTIPLPGLDAPDYASERERTPSPEHSVRSHGPGGTITSHDLSDRARPSPTIRPPARAPRSSARPAPTPIPILQRTHPFPSDASPGGLPPPPRPAAAILTPPASPSPYGPLSDEARRRYAERYQANLETSQAPVSRPEDVGPVTSEDASTTNLAGVGAGDARRIDTARSRPSSFHASRPDISTLDTRGPADDIPGLINPEGRSHHEFHNVPYVRDHRAEGWNGLPSGSASPAGRGVRSPANSRRNSLKKRPQSFRDSRPGSRRGSYTEGQSITMAEQPAQKTPSRDSKSPSVSRPSLIIRQSQTSLRPSKNSSPSSSRGQQGSTQHRRRAISSILGSFFSSDKTSAPPRRLSRPVRTTSKRSSRTSIPASSASEDLSPTALEPGLATAIRTSGTFGVGDDGTVYRLGSEATSSPSSPHSQPMRERRMSSGAVSVQSLGVQRVLYVSNVDETVVEDDEDPVPARPLIAQGSTSSLPNAKADENGTEESGTVHEVYYTPIDIGSPISPSSPSDQRMTEHNSARTGSADPTRPGFPHRRSLSPPAAPSATFVPLDTHFKQRPPTPPRTASVGQTADVASPVPADTPHAGALSVSQSTVRQPAHFIPITEKEEMVDESTQTSPGLGESTKRPLPRPPSVASRPPSLVLSSSSHVTASGPRSPGATPDRLARHSSGPRLYVPPPPPDTPARPGTLPQSAPIPDPVSSPGSSRPTSDLPLLIASHLLSTHAAALMRHSTTMRDVSGVMHQMATESLEWGGILLDMGQAGRPDPAQRYAPQAASSPYQPTDEPTAPNAGAMASGIDGLPSRAFAPNGPDTPESVRDPLRQAWEKLNGLGGKPFSSPRSPLYPAQLPTHAYAHVPEAQHPEADRFTSVPPRPSASRKSSPVRLNTDEPLRYHRPVSPFVGSRTRPDSLPADWLAEADRLGREGWKSLRKAEEAWSSAMTSLRELAERPPSSSRPMFAMAEDGERTIRARSRSRHESLDLSYPRRMDRADQIDRERSFLPDLSDRSSDRLIADDLRGQHSPVSAPRPPSGHPLLRPQPPPGSSVPQGYSAEHIGFENQSNIRERPRSRLAMTSTVIGGSGMQMGFGTDSRTGTRSRKHSKRVRPRDAAPTIPSTFRSGHRPASSGVGDVPADTAQIESVRSKAGESGTKSHWWSRRRTASVVS